MSPGHTPNQPEATNSRYGTIPRAALLAMIVLGALVPLWLLTGGGMDRPDHGRDLAGALLTAVTEGGMAALIAVAAGGFGYPVIRRLSPASAPPGLVVMTACGLGLWLISTAVLLVGAGTTGLLRPWLWWPVIAAGVILAAWQGRRRLEEWRIPLRLDGRALTWVALAAAVGVWLAGATTMPGLIKTPDAYDVLEYHLQAPREFYAAQHVGELRHNCYSYYPLGVEMLFLLGMCLRNGPYLGMYLAAMIHGMFAVLAVAAVFAALRAGHESRGRFAAILLGTTPLVLYLAWLAMVELAAVFYTVLAVLWMERWLGEPRAGSALCVGIAIGAACASKYLAVGLVAGPVVLAMLVMAFVTRRSAQRLWHAVLAGAVCCAIFSPWPIRNAATTGNPFFPLATTVFGRAHWSVESQQRWLNGHSPGLRPPVPAPPRWKPYDQRSRLELLYDNLVTSQQLSPLVLLLAGIAACIAVAAGRQGELWDWSLMIVLGAQIAVWAAFSHEMPTRFLAPAIGPICLLAGGAIASLASMKTSPFRLAKTGQPGPWGRPIAVALLASAAAINLIVAWAMYRSLTGGATSWHGQAAYHLDMQAYLESRYPQVLPSSRFMLVGDSRCWYWPVGTIYSTAFDSHPLAEMIEAGASPEDMLADLQRRGVTHLFVSWGEMWRLACTYGCQTAFSNGLLRRWAEGGEPGLDALDRLEALGAKTLPLEESFLAEAPWRPEGPRRTWPLVTIYAMPWAAASTTQSVTQPDSRTETAPASRARLAGS